MSLDLGLVVGDGGEEDDKKKKKDRRKKKKGEEEEKPAKKKPPSKMVGAMSGPGSSRSTIAAHSVVTSVVTQLLPGCHLGMCSCHCVKF